MDVKFMIFNVHFKKDIKNQYFQRHCRLHLFIFGREKPKIMDVKSVFCSSLSSGFYTIMSPSIELVCLVANDCNKPTDVG